MKKTKLLTLAVATAVASISLIGVTTATSSYIHEEEVAGIDTLTICDWDDSSKCITMKDRNEGATESGVVCNRVDYQCFQGYSDMGFSDYNSCHQDCRNEGVSSVMCGFFCTQNLHGYDNINQCNDAMNLQYSECIQANSGVLGNHYQWGNNYGFPNPGRTGRDSITDSAVTGTINTEGYGPGNWYSGSVFIYGGNIVSDWSDPINHNLRGGSGDSEDNNRGYPLTLQQAENRRGPCDTGYHVPSIGEWNQLLKYWADENETNLEDDDRGFKYNADSLDGFKFQEDFKIPFAGFRGGSMYHDALIYDIGDMTYLWSSSPNEFVGYSFRFSLSPYGAVVGENGGRVDGYSLRCFKDSPLSFSSIVAVKVVDGKNVLYRGEMAPGSKISDNAGVMAILNQDMTKTGYTFLGWYDEDGESKININKPLRKNTKIIAKWSVDYIYEKKVNGVNTITICDPVDEDICITMKDRNEGATKAGTECSESNSRACGYHFQWGNNHGFAPCLDSDYCTSFPNGETTSSGRIDCEPYSPSYPLDNSIFIVDWSDYCIDQNDNLRGGSGDNDDNGRGYPLTLEQAENRRGPCPEGYHVPSIGEWDNLLRIWVSIYTGIYDEYAYYYDNYDWWGHEAGDDDGALLLRFQEDFKIPFVGRRYSHAIVNNIGDLDAFISDIDMSYLWSSSPGAYHLALVSGWPGVGVSVNGGRGEASSVRCFKDSPLSFPSYIESTNSGIQVTVGETEYNSLPAMEVTTNYVVNVQEDKTVAGEVSVSFGENVSAKFSDLVKINVPVEDYDQVIIKVKHAGSSGYNFDGLTTNANASCDANGRPTSSQYNGELITVVNGFASIYTCEASDFIALGSGGLSGNNISGVVVTLTLTAGENSCTINDYNLGTHNVSAQEQYVSASGQDIACRFLKNSGAIVTLSMGNLVDGTKTIGNQYFTGIVTNIGPSLGSIANLAGGSYNLGATRAIYTKAENTIGSWTGSLALEGTIPAGTPSGEYTGAIEIVIQQPTWTE